MKQSRFDKVKATEEDYATGRPIRKPVTEVGDPCRHCGTSVIRREHKANWKPRRKQPYYFKWWLKCPRCRATYMVEVAKVTLRPQAQRIDWYDAVLCDNT